MSNKYFNKAVIWGVIDNAKERTANNAKKTPYLDIFIKCKSEVYGDILTRFRLYDLEAIGHVKELHTKNPEALWKFSGYIDQYEKEGKLLSGGSGFQAELLEEKTIQRSAFILTGEFNGMSIKKDRQTTRLGVIIKTDGHDDTEFFAEIRDKDKEALGFKMSDIIRGDTLQLRGHLADLDAEFGSSGALCLMVEKYNFTKKPIEEKDEF